MLSAIVLSEDPAVGIAVQELASESRQVNVVKSSERPPATAYEIARLFNTYAPDLTFIDLRDPAGALNLLQLVFGQDPSAIVIALGSKLPASWRQKFEEYGLASYLEFPMNVEEFERAIIHAIRKVRTTISEKLVVFLPAKAGSGSTTVALNVAGCLAHLGKQVLLLDSKPSVPIVNVLARSSSLDSAAWGEAVSRCVGIDMLLTDTVTTRPLPTWVNYHQLLRFALGRYDHIVADLPEVINSATEELVRSAKAVMVVCTPEMLSLTLTRRRIAELHRREIPEDRIHVVLNRWHSTDISVDDIGKLLKHKIAAVLPNDYRCVNTSVIESTLIAENSNLGRSLTGFARELTGEAVEAAKSKRTFWFGPSKKMARG